MATVLTGHVFRRIAAERAHVDEPGAFGIRPEPAAAIARRCGGQTRRARRRGRMGSVAEAGEVDVSGVIFLVNKRGSRRAAFRDVPGAADRRVVGEWLNSTHLRHSYYWSTRSASRAASRRGRTAPE
jgi:hypothetical protein